MGTNTNISHCQRILYDTFASAGMLNAVRLRYLQQLLRVPVSFLCVARAYQQFVRGIPNVERITSGCRDMDHVRLDCERDRSIISQLAMEMQWRTIR